MNADDPKGLEMSRAIDDVIAERYRQVEEKGYSPEHDDGHAAGELAMAGSCYAQHAFCDPRDVCGCKELGYSPERWPWFWDSWSSGNPRHDLVRAAALIMAEIDRMDRDSERQL